MAGFRDYYICGFVILAFSTGCAMSSASSKTVKGAYWPSWAVNFPPSAIDTTFFTHIYYAFLAPNSATFKFDVSDSSTARSLLNFTSTLHSKNPPVKTLFSVGGAGEGHALFSRMAATAASRKSFIDSSIEVARKFGFDGVDLDWEFPQTPKEMDDYGYLLEEWRAEVEKEANATGRPPLLLSAAVYFSIDFFLSDVRRSYPVGPVSKNLDWINVMCYDYHGSWDTSKTGAHAALFDPNSNISTSYGLGSWIKAGVPRSKLIMGLPLYGRTWKLKDPNSNGIGAPAVGVGPENGTMAYSHVERFNAENNATVVFDLITVSTYSYSGTSWIGYDDVRSTSVKIAYAQSLRLRGYFFWAVNYDYNWKISREASKLWVRR